MTANPGLFIRPFTFYSTYVTKWSSMLIYGLVLRIINCRISCPSHVLYKKIIVLLILVICALILIQVISAKVFFFVISVHKQNQLSSWRVELPTFCDGVKLCIPIQNEHKHWKILVISLCFLESTVLELWLQHKRGLPILILFPNKFYCLCFN